VGVWSIRFESLPPPLVRQMSLSRKLASSLAGVRWTTAMTTRMAVYALPCVLRRVGEGYFFNSAQVGCR